MKHGSLFSGIGGFDLAAQWMGWKNVFHCEYNPFGQRVLKYYWPNAISYTDVKEADFTRHAGQIDILTGGFPCQPYSTAGKRLGKEDDRHLWPEMLRAIREISPRYVVGENVRGLLSWNRGVVFDEVQTDLETEGYNVLPFLLPACAVNAPHRRDRVWFIAYAGNGLYKGELDNRRNPSATGRSKGEYQQKNGRNEDRQRVRAEFGTIGEDATNAHGNKRRKGGLYEKEPQTTERYTSSRNTRGHERGGWQNFPTQPPVCGRNDGVPTELDGITVSRHRRESMKAYGNAIVPQLAYKIFKAIEETELIIYK
jgi:DNA (cytosine-5)-methyltransferase 1